jgi:hypothetical protein
MFGDGPLTFQEFATREPLPLARVHDAVLAFLRDREDAVLIGAQAVNAYVDTPRFTKDVDVLSPRAAELADDIRTHLARCFGIGLGIRSRDARQPRFRGEGNRREVYQERKPRDRRLVAVWQAPGAMPPARVVDRVQVIAPPALVSAKLCRAVACRHSPSWGLHLGDLYRLLLAFPELKAEEGPVAEQLRAAGAGEEVMAAWKELVARIIEPDDEDAGY